MSLPSPSSNASATAIKFGHPATLIAETPHWLLLLRPKQVTLGSLVLLCKQSVTAFGDVSAEGFADFGLITPRIERLLQGFTNYQRINYLMLMMIDPDVHFHVIPRYSEPREYAGLQFADAGWPNPPSLGAAVEPDAHVTAAMVTELQQRWAQG